MTTGKPNDISEDAWDAARERVAAILVFTGEAAMTEIVARAILAERERINALIEKKAQPFSDSRNPLASELVAALDDLRVCVTRGEVA